MSLCSWIADRFFAAPSTPVALRGWEFVPYHPETHMKLGNELKDIVSGVSGIAVARVEYLNGCVQFCIQPRAADGKRPDCMYIDQQQLVLEGEGVTVSQKETGGVMDHTPSAHYRG